MSLQAPVFLATLALPLLAVAAYVWLQRRPAKYAVAYPNLAVLRTVARRERPWRRHLTALLLAAAVALLCVGVARPQMTMMVPSERATVVLALDVSGSMRSQDVAPTRLDAARAAVDRFLDRVPDQVRVGLVLFSSEPYVAVPPTHDHDSVREALQLALPDRGTAIGDALSRSVELAKRAAEEDTPPGGNAKATLAAEVTPLDEKLATIVFLSDGFQTRGVLTPAEAADQAREAGIPVHTVALGTDSGVIELERYGERRVIPVPPDRETLRAIAETTGGKAYEVRDADRLVDVYDSLGSSVGRVPEEREVTAAFVGIGAVLVAAAGLLAGFWSPRLP
jgi:Ca-activated chloride channel homolog